MKELEYPFDPGYIMKKRRSIKKQLLKTDKPFIEKRIAVLGGSTTHDVFDNNDIVVTEQTNANDIEEWDSLIHITLISAVEDEFDVSFDMKTAVSMKDVGDMIDAIEEQI